MNIKKIAKKVERGERLTFDDGLFLMESPDLLAIGQLADIMRKRKNGDNAYYIINKHINHTNICINECRFCAFQRKEGEDGGYAWAIDEVMKKAGEDFSEDISEFHIVGGLHPELPYSYYREIIARLHEKYPNVHLQAFTAVEIDYFAEISGKNIKDVLIDLKDAGLGSLPGGGAEVFNDKVRKKICPNKISGKRWLEVMETAHNAGLRSNATLLYGHIEKPEDRIDHMVQLRELQDRTGGFMAFIPLAFHPKNTELAERHFTSGQLDIRMLAVSRLMLDNFDHIKAFWIMISPKISQLSLIFGVDDIDGTVLEERITHSAGAETEQGLTVSMLENLITSAGRVPVRRDTLYNAVGGKRVEALIL
ncbi:MAG: aminofutalosine synthase MqnE [Nitrospinota bacterium]|nr:aminofutalosine synthase MqnE [Nitrospinota bacterium]